MGLSIGRQVPLGPALQDGAKGHNMKGKYLTGKLRPLGWSFKSGLMSSDFRKSQPGREKNPNLKRTHNDGYEKCRPTHARGN